MSTKNKKVIIASVLLLTGAGVYYLSNRDGYTPVDTKQVTQPNVPTRPFDIIDNSNGFDSSFLSDNTDETKTEYEAPDYFSENIVNKDEYEQLEIVSNQVKIQSSKPELTQQSIDIVDIIDIDPTSDIIFEESFENAGEFLVNVVVDYDLIDGANKVQLENLKNYFDFLYAYLQPGGEFNDSKYNSLYNSVDKIFGLDKINSDPKYLLKNKVKRYVNEHKILYEILTQRLAQLNRVTPQKTPLPSPTITPTPRQQLRERVIEFAEEII